MNWLVWFVVHADRVWSELTPAQKRALDGGHARACVFDRLTARGLWDGDIARPSHWGRFVRDYHNGNLILENWTIGEDGDLYVRKSALA